MTLFKRKYKYIMQTNNVAMTVQKIISFGYFEVCFYYYFSYVFILKTQR